ncbi:MAG TPA: hypothetical protein VFI57_03205, partial [Pyrinomonadaceae bacterium]|nr:hypothetical protein [Pyrinomonadaceae bacterium]
MKRIPSILLLLVAFLSFAPAAVAQPASTALANLPEADALIYISPQRILNDAIPKVMPAAEVAKMQAAFADMKRGVGVDPATVEYIVIAVRFHKPAADLSFVAPDVMAVVGGDFSSESLFTLAQLTLQDKVRMETHGSKTIALMTIDPIAAEAQKNPILKPFVEVGAVALSPNSLAIGNLRYLQSAVEAAAGTGRIKPETLQSLLRDPNVLMAATGAPIASFARSFGLFGTESTPRDGRCDSNFGNFYAAATVSGANYSIRGAMNADNPDTAKIIANLLSGLMKTDLGAIPDKTAQTILQSLKLTAKDNEVM